MSCGGDGTKGTPQYGATVAPAVATNNSGQSSGADKPTPAPATTAAVPTAAPVTGGEAIAFMTADGMTLKGTLFTAPGPKRRVVFIAVQAPDTEADWQPFAKEVATGGTAVMTVAMPRYKDAAGVGDRDLSNADKDMETGVLLLESRDYPQVYLISEYVGGVGAVRLANRKPLGGLALVSANAPAGADLTGLSKAKGAKLFLAGEDSTYGPAVGLLNQSAADPKQSRVFASRAQGAKLFASPDGATFKQMLKDFLTK
jgi:hypothetical protein